MQARQLLLIFVCMAVSSFALAGEPAEPVTSWSYPPEMPGSRVEVYRKVGDVELNAWIFEPKGHKASDRRPAIVFFFGGGWRGGTPGQFLPHSTYLASRGMVAISCDYRVKNRNMTLPQDAVTDAKAAIRWVRENADRLGVDPERIVASGGSAGGHLAAATGTVPGFEPKDAGGKTSSMPNAMVLFNPAVVLAPVEGRKLLPEDKIEDIRERCNGRPEEISPFHHTGSGVSPTIIFHGTADEAVPHVTVAAWTQKMKAAGNRCELVSFDGQPHGFFNPGRGKGEPRREANRRYHETTRRMDAFLVSLGYLK